MAENRSQRAQAEDQMAADLERWSGVANKTYDPARLRAANRPLSAQSQGWRERSPSAYLIPLASRALRVRKP
jgi:hypothetical protein